MITNITIENYKSVEKVNLNLGRINVFIGENGAGKSNILEAIALAGAAGANKLDNEFLASRGVRITAPNLITNAFSLSTKKNDISISIQTDNQKTVKYRISTDKSPYSKWNYTVETGESDATINSENLDVNYLLHIIKEFKSSNDYPENTKRNNISEFLKVLNRVIESPESQTVTIENASELTTFISNFFAPVSLEQAEFIVYSPEISSLKSFSQEGQILPLGINGEGMFRLIEVLTSTKEYSLSDELNEFLNLFGWFESFKIEKSKSKNFSSPYKLKIKDKNLDKKIILDQSSTNEGFIFSLFYFSLFSNGLTPKFFAIDNIENSLNPKMVAKLIEKICDLAKKNNKQAILTTHNPATLDGLNLDDDEQRLFVVYRAENGRTKIRRIKKPSSEKPVRLSEAFLRGALGGLPEHF